MGILDAGLSDGPNPVRCVPGPSTSAGPWMERVHEGVVDLLHPVPVQVLQHGGPVEFVVQTRFVQYRPLLCSTLREGERKEVLGDVVEDPVES